jgi:hypothetical protein
MYQNRFFAVSTLLIIDEEFATAGIMLSIPEAMVTYGFL